MNHVWAVIFKDAESAKKLVALRDVKVKDLRCMVIDAGNQVLRVKVPWVLYGVPDDLVRAAFAPFGVVTEVARDRWRVSGCNEKGTTTRLVSLKLKAGMTPDDVPHQLRIAGDNALVVVPGRLPLCLRCHRSGHVRRECRVPRCTRCRRSGHDDSQCVQTYASVAGPAGGDDKSEHLMDEAEAEEVAAGGGGDVPAPTPAVPVQVTGKDPQVQQNEAQNLNQEVPAFTEVAKESGSEDNQGGGAKDDDDDIVTMDTSKEPAGSTCGKRVRESNAGPTDEGTATPDEPPPKAPPGRRSTLRPKPNVPPDRRAPETTPAATPT
ncbi:uncharacterized protein LOC144180155 [Haemaphysalis longicornis]